MKKIILAILVALQPLMAMAEKIPQAIWTEGNTTLTFINDETVYAPGDTYNGETVTGAYTVRLVPNVATPAWLASGVDVKDKATTVVFDASFSTVRPASNYYWFYRFTSLASIVGIENLDTSNSTSMQCMFYDCKSLQGIDLSHFQTSKVLNMNAMFYGCSSLTTIDLSAFDTQNVSNMSYMFSACPELTSVDLSSFDTRKVTTMEYMFSNSKKLASLNLSNFYTPSLTNMAYMFYACSALKTLDLSNFDTSNVTTMNTTFGWCSSLNPLDLSNFRTPKLTNMARTFDACTSLIELDLSTFDTSNVTTMSETFTACNNLTTLDISSFNTSKVTNMRSMFHACLKLKPLDVSHFDTQNVKDMTAMFMLCRTLTELDVSGFNTSKVTSMQSMFSTCQGITELDVSNFDTQNVTSMSAMFSSCSKLSSLDVSNFNTQNVTNMSKMFQFCNQLTELDVSNFNTAKVTDMSYIFGGCSKLKELDVTNFDTQNVTNMSNMFDYCRSLTSLDVTGFNTSKVTNMSGMFNWCSNLEELELRNFDTSKVTNMNSMFNYASKLYYIDLTGFDFSRTPSTQNMLWKIDSTFVYLPTDMPSNVKERLRTSRNWNTIFGDAENGFSCTFCYLFDDREPRIPYPFTAHSINYDRKIAKGGNGNTIMLPFDLDVPEGMRAYRMKGATGQVKDDIIYFQQMAQGEPMLANTPYLLANWGTYDYVRIQVQNTPTLVHNTISYYDLAGTTQLTSYEGSETVETTLKDGTHVTMSGTFRTMPNSEVADQGIYIFQTGNKWKQVKSSNTSAYIRPYRAYLTKTGGGPSGVSLFNSVLMADTDDTTPVEELHLSSPNDGSVQYDLSGRRVSGPRKGIRVTKGKKVSTSKLSL